MSDEKLGIIEHVIRERYRESEMERQRQRETFTLNKLNFLKK